MRPACNQNVAAMQEQYGLLIAGGWCYPSMVLDATRDVTDNAPGLRSRGWTWRLLPPGPQSRGVGLYHAVNLKINYH